ncbi:hypothetical protein [Psychroserpens mesophilus]|uniref:hypothetical protein n=1 Tax=Psychroserpens mesophilus TaxID=325473 RepID=UPI003D6587E1
MKISKFILLVVLSITIFSCGSDDDDNDSQEPQNVNINPTITINTDAVIALPPDSDITGLVDFGQPNGVSTSDYLVELTLNDLFTLKRPEGLLPGDVFLIFDIEFYDELDGLVDYEDDVEPFLGLVIPDGQPSDYYTSTEATNEGVPVVIFRADNALDNNDLDWKYNIICYITRDGTEYGPYIIDPKIKIKSTNGLS